MSAEVEEQILIDERRGLYRESWKGVIVDESFAHPAKFSRALIQHIYEHVIQEGWTNKGDSVVDPFGGVALGAFPAMQHGLVWYGCELEEKFVALGNQNIALWNDRYSRMPNWGSAHLLQGDSRKLIEVLSAADCCVSSPPYAGNEKSDYLMSDDGKTRRRDEKRGFRQGDGCFRGSEGAYGQSDGQLGAMKEGDHTLVVSSPPFPQPYTGGGGINVKGYSNEAQRKGSSEKPFDLVGKRTYQGKGGDRSDGNLETLDLEGFQAAISSPPYEATRLADEAQWAGVPRGECHSIPEKLNGYGAATTNRTIEDRETFWSASRLILEQLHQVIIPSGHAVFVVKAFVRDKKIVDFPTQWAQLCEAVGFRLLHDHHALLTEHYGTQGGFDQDKQLSVERKSFFRRLAEAKGSPRIDHENVLCFERP